MSNTISAAALPEVRGCRWCSKPIGDADLMHSVCAVEWVAAGRWLLAGTVACSICAYPTGNAAGVHADCESRARRAAAAIANPPPTYYPSPSYENAAQDRAEAELDMESNRFGDGRGRGETDAFNPRGAW